MKTKMIAYRSYKGLKVLCKKCGYEIHNIGINGLKTDCTHPIEHQTYKAVLIEPSTGKKKTKNLAASTYDEAVAELLTFKESLANPLPVALLHEEKSERPMTLAGCMAMYIDYLNGEGVLEFEKRQRDITYLKNTKYFLKKFMEYLKVMKIDTRKIRVDEVTDKIVEGYYKQVKSITNSAATFNNMFKPLKGLYRFLIDKRDYTLRNPFKNVPHLAEGGNPKAFLYEDILKIKAAISPEDSIMTYGSGAKKEMYKPWLADAIDLAVFTGVRREQVVEMKWSDIVCDPNGNPIYIKSNDLKVNRMQNRNGTKKDKYIHVPISDELRDLLVRLGIKKHVGQNWYLLAPEEKKSRKTIVEQMSAAFTFFRNKAGVDPELSFKSLRKTYLSHMEHLHGGNTKSFSGHSRDAVLDDHYLDRSIVARKATEQGFSLFDDGVKKNNPQQPWPDHARVADTDAGD